MYLGKADTATKAYTGQNDIFADAFNFYLYDGKPVIVPNQLRELDVTELSLPYGTDGKESPIQKYRDVLKVLTAMEDGRATYLLLGIENQSSVHYAAPVRNLLYDALQYAKQVEKTAERHRREKDFYGRGKGEFLSGFYKEDKILPVITLIILFSPDRWDAPLSLHEMMQIEDPAILNMVPDYRLNLIIPADIPLETFRKFHTSLGNVLTFIKYFGNKENLSQWIYGAGADVTLGRMEIDVLNTCVNAKIAMSKEEKVVPMCEALRQLEADAAARAVAEMAEEVRREVTEEVKREVTEEVKREVTKEVTTEVTENVQLRSLKNVMRNLHLTAEQALAALEIFGPERETLIRKLQ